MFLNSVILVLQEILEAALLISVLLVLIKQLQTVSTNGFLPAYRWLYHGLLGGFVGAWLYALAIPSISTWFDYVGIEVVNSFMQILIIICLICLCYGMSFNKLQYRNDLLGTLTTLYLGIVVALGIIREASEIIIYMSGVIAQPDNFTPVLLGGFIALGIGISSGIFLFYLLTTFSNKWAFRSCMLLLALFAGNMASQACLLLIQADWLPYTTELWNTSSFLPENMVVGQLLFALIGYEANPSWLQAASYLCGTLLILCSPLFRDAWFQKPAKAEI